MVPHGSRHRLRLGMWDAAGIQLEVEKQCCNIKRQRGDRMVDDNMTVVESKDHSSAKRTTLIPQGTKMLEIPTLPRSNRHDESYTPLPSGPSCGSSDGPSAMATQLAHHPIRADVRSLETVAIVLMTLLVASCTSFRGPVTSSPSAAGCQRPVMSPVPETPVRQTQGDISMLLALETPQCERAVEISWEEGGRVGFFGIGPGPDYIVRRTERDILRLESSEMTAIVAVTNQSDRVFRGEDAIWTASVDGAVIPSEVGGMVGAVVPPGRDVEIRIPSIQLNPAGGTYVFSIFDVPIRRNAAGQTTEVGNFEWIYTLGHEAVQEGGTTTTCEFRVDSPTDYPGTSAEVTVVRPQDLEPPWSC